MTEEQSEAIKRLAERDSSRAEALHKALDAADAKNERELKMLRRSSNYSTSVFMSVVVSSIAMGCGGAEPRATCIITVAAIAALTFAWTKERSK